MLVFDQLCWVLHPCMLSFMLGSQLTDSYLTLPEQYFSCTHMHDYRIVDAISGAGKMYCYGVPINCSFH